MLRLEKLISDYDSQIQKKEISVQIIEDILNADITKGKYSRFLIECFLNQKFLIEDLQGGLTSTIGQTITLFHKHKNKLPNDMRSVFKYKSPLNILNEMSFVI